MVSYSTESYTPTDIFGGESDIVTTSGVIASGNNVAQYTALGRITTTGKYAPWNPGATDGTQTAVAIAAVAINATSADLEGPIFVAGVFNQDVLVFANGTALQQAAAFDRSPIVVRKVRYSGI